MAVLYKCDKCNKNTIEVLQIFLAYERTEEEIKELVKNSRIPISYDDMRLKSIVKRDFEVCKKCYEEIKKI